MQSMKLCQEAILWKQSLLSSASGVVHCFPYNQKPRKIAKLNSIVNGLQNLPRETCHKLLHRLLKKKIAMAVIVGQSILFIMMDKERIENYITYL